MDPRVHAGPAALRAQFTLAQRIVTAMNRSYAAMRAASARKDAPAAAALARLNAAFGRLLGVVEGADAAPTPAAAEAARSLERQLAAALAR